MKNAIIILICVFLLSTLLCGCSADTKEVTKYDNPLYSITVKDGLYNLIPKTQLTNVDAQIRLELPQFESLEEMRQAIILGSFTERELYALSRQSTSADGKIEICDLDNLYQYTAPAEIGPWHITLMGKYYPYYFDGEKMGKIVCFDKKEDIGSYSAYQGFLSNPLITLTKQEKIAERSATVYYCYTDLAEMKYICYEIRVGKKKMLIQEEYLLKHKPGVLEESSEVPQTVEFWGEENGGYFYGSFLDFTERPSVEWLSEFGIMPLDT